MAITVAGPTINPVPVTVTAPVTAGTYVSGAGGVPGTPGFGDAPGLVTTAPTAYTLTGFVPSAMTAGAVVVTSPVGQTTTAGAPLTGAPEFQTFTGGGVGYGAYDTAIVAQGPYADYLSRQYGEPTTGPIDVDAYIPRDAAGRSQYDLQRQTIDAASNAEMQAQLEELDAYLAQQGITGPAAVKMRNELVRNIMINKAAQTNEVNMAELAAKQEIAGTIQGQRWQREERLGEQAFTAELSYAKLNQDERGLAEQAREFDNQYDFDVWAEEQGWTNEERNRVWQAVQNDANRSLSYDELAVKVDELRNQIAFDYTQLAAATGVDRDEILARINMNQADLASAERLQQYRSWADMTLESLGATLNMIQMGYETVLSRETDLIKARAQSYYNMGLGGLQIPEDQLALLASQDPMAYYSYLDGAAGLAQEVFDANLGLRMDYMAARIANLGNLSGPAFTSSLNMVYQDAANLFSSPLVETDTLFTEFPFGEGIPFAGPVYGMTATGQITQNAVWDQDSGQWVDGDTGDPVTVTGPAPVTTNQTGQEVVSGPSFTPVAVTAPSPGVLTVDVNGNNVWTPNMSFTGDRDDPETGWLNNQITAPPPSGYADGYWQRSAYDPWKLSSVHGNRYFWPAPVNPLDYDFGAPNPNAGDEPPPGFEAETVRPNAGVWVPDPWHPENQEVISGKGQIFWPGQGGPKQNQQFQPNEDGTYGATGAGVLWYGPEDISRGGILTGEQLYRNITPQYQYGSDEAMNWIFDVSSLPLQSNDIFDERTMVESCQYKLDTWDVRPYPDQGYFTDSGKTYHGPNADVLNEWPEDILHSIYMARNEISALDCSIIDLDRLDELAARGDNEGLAAYTGSTVNIGGSPWIIQRSINADGSPAPGITAYWLGDPTVQMGWSIGTGRYQTWD